MCDTFRFAKAKCVLDRQYVAIYNVILGIYDTKYLFFKRG